ncbi:Multifunctional cytochrome P450 monooxygenase af510 [Metarhizium brunneum]|uniref:Multifunctional cytochrome P450 monooxygenase af510 n=1 Tax=Metarhizium brunneum TaxID=500148 RepID=A0A7D5ZAJ2_9HYPO|nr:Multifunctional cytochrome P450 monooxygenase af510 [Metarhizium brunneum]
MSAVTSFKPTTVFAFQLCGFWRFLSQLPYNDMYRRERKLMHQELGTKAAVARYYEAIESEVGRFLARLFARPEDLFQLLRTEVGSIILKITYGYSTNHDTTDPLVDLISHVMLAFSHALQPFYWLVDIIPAISYLPDWLPGMGFKEIARRTHKMSDLMVDVPYSFVLRQMRSGSYLPSYVSKLVEQFNKDTGELKISRDNEDTIKYTAGTLYAGGSDTSATTLNACILAMIMFPEVQRKAQEEIDLVIGNERLPSFKDQEKLPYIDSIVKEVLRWFPVAPMGSAHETTEDITYSGYLIPKGAILSPAVWWFCHDPQVYSNPSSFDPGRFLEPRNEPDPTGIFGYGRRICLGRYLANATIFLTIAQTLAIFNISKAIDKNGVEIKPACKPTHGMISRLVNFPYRISLRGEKQVRIIQSNTVEQLGEDNSTLLDTFTIK